MEGTLVLSCKFLLIPNLWCLWVLSEGGRGKGERERGHTHGTVPSVIGGGIAVLYV